MNSSELNDVMLKFINPEVYDIQDPEQKAQYLTEREQFRKYMEAQQVLDEGDLTNFATTETEIETAIENSSDSLIQQAQQQGSGRAQFLPHQNQRSMSSRYVDSDDIDNVVSLQFQDRSTRRTDRFVQERDRYVNIDSEDRDQAVFPFQNSYRFDFTKNTFTNVIKIEMIGSEFINAEQLIRSTPASLQNNIIQWQIEDDEEGGEPVTYSAVLNVGNYSADTLQTEIQTRMNAVERIDDKGFHDFEVSIDIETDVVSFSHVEFFSTEDDPFVATSFFGTPLFISFFFPDHGRANGDIMLVEGITESIGGIPPSVLNGIHSVLVLSSSVIFFLLGIPDFVDVPAKGGPGVRISFGLPFKLLFSESDSPAAVLGFPEEDTEFNDIHFNSQEIFVYGNAVDDFETGRRLKINHMLPGDESNTTKIRTTLPHKSGTGTRIFIHNEQPDGTTIDPYDHTYDTLPLNGSEMAIRNDFVVRISSPAGLIITVIDSFTFSVPVSYGDYVTTDSSTISTFIGINVADDDENGDVILRQPVKLDFNGNQYIFMTSEAIGGDFVGQNDELENIFAKIQLAAQSGKSAFNTFIGGQKIFYDTPLTLLESIDFQFVYGDGSEVQFNDEDHSFVLRITEAIQKVEGVGFSAQIGTRT